MPFFLVRDDGCQLSDDPARLDLDRICRWLGESYWAADRDRATIARSIENSQTYGLYTPGDAQIGLCRVTTDLATFAWIGDVVIDPEWRGRGLGSWLVASVVERLQAHGVPRFLLATRDAHGVYERLGFTALEVPAIWMELDTRPGRARPDEPIGRDARASRPGLDR
jgi:GNAT superfamily N-acetyltransferase